MSDRPQRRLAAILAADVAGYSRLVGLDEEGTVLALRALRDQVTDPLIARYGGRIANTAGDSLLAEFPSAVEAVRCAVELQAEVAARTRDAPEDRRIAFRIGINLGDVIAQGDDLLGDGVNVAARLEGLAEAGGICLSRAVRDQIVDKLPVALIDLGAIRVKNISRPVEAFRVEPEGQVSAPRRPTRTGVLLAMGLIVVAGLGAAVWKPWAPGIETASVASMAFPLPDRPSIVVMPFTSYSDEARQSQFADGITDDLITDLSKLSGLFVIARNTSFAFRGTTPTVKAVSERLGVRYILEGSVRRSGDTLRMNAHLIDATTGEQLWADRFDGAASDIFAAQDAFTLKVIDALRVELSEAEKSRITQIETLAVDAKEAFQAGWDLYSQFNRDDNARSVGFFKTAVERDPDYGRAWAALALVHLRAAVFFDWDIAMGEQDAALYYQDVPRYLERAEELGSPLVHVVHAMQYLNYRDRTTPEGKNRGTDDARIAAAAAIAAQPNDPEAHITMAWALIAAGQAREGLNFVQAAMRLNPEYPSHYDLFLAAAQYSLGNHDAARQALTQGLARDPRAFELMPMLASLQAMDGDRPGAAATLAAWANGRGSDAVVSDVQRYFFPIRWVDQDLNDWLKGGLFLAALPTAETVETLMAELSGAPPADKVQAIRKLGWFGPAAAPAVDLLTEALADAARSVQREAAITLGKIGPAAAAAVPALTALTGEPIIGYHASVALARIAAD